MDLQLANEVTVVIGAASGLGKAIALEFAREGATLVLVDIAPAVESLAAEIQRDLKTAARAFTADVTDYPALQQIAAAAIAEFGRCDHVLVPAGIGSGKFGFPFWNLEPADWDRVLRVNLLGPVHAAHAFSPPMIAARHGTFLFFTSIAGQIGSQTDPPYSAAKAAVINFTQCAAKDLAPYNVRVNAISPGMIKTPLNRSVWQAWYNQQPEDQRQSYEDWAGEKARRVAPLGRWQTPDDIAAAAVFLASRRAQNITGQTINVDGGQVMHS
ncbi:MAG: SDR family oxidoreductase [Pirellulaceae bacterium]|jgi:NAD(P)-dependent dehydrogenase (short-subunit alcohol dehydrogenase family)|nr:SDR family oxidoreductase [Pirellulaceae bacterium]MCU0982463.1 SDR family oxidoreductase [Pirellulaceae bacterium]